MKANVPQNATILKTPEDAKALAQKLVKQGEEQSIEKKNTLVTAMEEVKNINPQLGGFDEIAALLTLSEEAFALIAPAFLHELEKSYNNVNDQLALVQAMNVAGIKSEQVGESYTALCQQIDEQMVDSLSAQKRDFVKRLISITYNAISEADGIAKRQILVPIEYCRDGAKMPQYAHLSDAGMDVYLTEDVIIHPGETKLIPLGIKCALPFGYELQVRPRSGISLKSKLRIANAPGTIDSGYRDEIGIIVDNIDPVIRSASMDENGRLYDVIWGSDITLEKGTRIAQLVLSETPKAIFYEVETITMTGGENRDGGFGSSGDK